VHAVEPAAAEYDPFAQVLQLPLPHEVPIGHMHEVEPAADVEPAGHAGHVYRVPGVELNVLIAQGGQTVADPSVSPAVPAGHRMQAVIPEFGAYEPKLQAP
jgi:hypothetical protein